MPEVDTRELPALKVGRTYRSPAGNVWLVLDVLPGDRVRVRLESGPLGGVWEYVWPLECCHDLERE